MVSPFFWHRSYPVLVGSSTTTEKFMCTCELLLIFCTQNLSTILAMQESKNTEADKRPKNTVSAFL
jgi:hypothetical protein